MSDADELLRLRLRVEELEHELADARRAGAEARTKLDALARSPIWRVVNRAQSLSRRMRSDVRVERQAGQVAPGFVRLPLLGFAADVPVRWADEVMIDGVALPALLADARTQVSYRITASQRLRFRSFAGVRAGTEFGNIGGVRFSAVLRDPAGTAVARAERVLDPRRVPRHRRWFPLELEFPEAAQPAEYELVLSTELPEGAVADYAWAVWGDPVLLAGAHSRSAASRAGALLRRRRSTPEEVSPERGPTISFLLPVHDPDPAVLARTLESVFRQTSDGWQLCICDDGSRDPGVRAVLEQAVERDPRVLLVRHDTASGISGATNSAFGLATGDYVAALDHDDTLAPEAVAVVAARLAADPALDMLYSDNDKELGAGRRFAPAFKPDWAPEYLRACMYTLHLGVYRRGLVERLGGWRSEFDGAQDHDLVLRLLDAGARVAHEPTVLYHWGVHAGSTAQDGDAKPEAFERGVEAVEAHLRRSGIPGHAERLPIAGRYRVVHDREPSREVDVVVPEPEGDDEARALEALRAAGVQLTVVSPRQTAGAALAAGVAAGTAPVVVVFAELAVPETADWLDELTGLAREPGIGAAGALVLDREGRTVHAGVALPRGLPLPVHLDADPGAEDPPPELTMVTNRSAAEGVVAFDRSALAEAGGIPVHLDRLALTAATVAVGRGPHRVVVTPHASLRLVQERSVAAVIDVNAVIEVSQRYGAAHDPLYNPNLWADRASHVVPMAWQRAALTSSG